MDSSPPAAVKHTTAWGVACGAGAALCWSLGFVAARQGVTAGLSPLVLALHRFVWPGLRCSPSPSPTVSPICAISAGAAASRTRFIRRSAARAVQLSRLPVRAARPRRHHSTVLRRARRHDPGATCAERSFAGAPHRRRHRHRRRSRRDRRRSACGRWVAKASPAICCSSPPAAALRSSACCCGCGAFRRCARSAVTTVLSLAGLPILLFDFDNMLAAGFCRKSDAGGGAGRLRRRRRDLSVHPRGHSARRRPRRFVSRRWCRRSRYWSAILRSARCRAFRSSSDLLIVVVGFRLTQQS